MSKPSRRANRERRPKKKRDRELKRQIEELPVVLTLYDEKGYEYVFDLGCVSVGLRCVRRSSAVFRWLSV